MKKILIHLVVFVLLFNTCISAFAQDEISAKPYDEEVYAQAVVLLESLIGENLFSNPQQPLTRGMFADALARLFKVKELAAGTDAAFSDVRSDSEFFASVQALYEYGAVSKNTNFNPDRVITYNEAAKMTVIMAGYDTVAQNKGGWFNGYNYAALRLGLSDDVKNVNNLTCADGAIILFNLLFADALEADSYTKVLPEGTIEEKYSTQGNNYLQLLYDLYACEGIVTQTSYNSLMMDYKDFDKFICIDGEKYLYDGKLHPDMLGKNVVAIYSDKSDRELFCMFEHKNETFAVDGPDFEKINSGRFYYYDENKHLKDEKLDDLFVVIYNGRRTDNLTKKMVEELNSEITLLDNDNDGVYEVVFADSYTYGEIDTVNFVDDTIGLSLPQPATFDIDEEHSYFKVFDEEGKETGISALSKGMIAAVKCSADGIIAEVRILNKVVSGKMSVYDSENNIVVINDTEYKLTKAFSDKYITTKLLKLGESIDAIVTDNNVIVALKSTDAVYRYGYLTEHGKAGGLSKDIQIEVFSSGGEFEVYTIADKVTLDGVKSEPEDVYTALEAGLSLKLVKYSLNDKGEINRLDLADTYENYVAQTPAYKFGEELPKDNSLLLNKQASSQYRTNFNGFAGFASMSGSVIFFIPDDETDEDNYNVYSLSDIPGNASYDWEAYDVSLSGAAGAVIIRFSDMGIFARAYSSFIVEKVKYARLDDGEFGKCLYGYIDGEYRELYLDEETESDFNAQYPSLESAGFDPGDILRVSLSGDVIKNIEIDFELRENGRYEYMGAHNERDTFFANTSVEDDSTNSGYYGMGSSCYVEGNVYSVKNGYIYIALNRTPDSITEDMFNYENLRLFKISGNVVSYDRETKEVRPISQDLIKTYQSYGTGCDHVIMRLRDSRDLMTLVIE